MKPAICAVCGKSAVSEEPGACGDWVEFVEYQPPLESELGHPAGFEYFCGEHVSGARELRSKPSDVAIAQLRAQYQVPTTSHGKTDGNTHVGKGWFVRAARKLGLLR